MSQVVGEEKVVPAETLRPNPWNPNVMSDFMFERERASIREFGFLDSILVRTLEDGSREIIDGEHRWKAAVLEGCVDVKVNDLGPLSDAKAKQLTIILNETRGDPDKLKLAALVKSIVEADEAAINVLPFEEDEIKRMIEIGDYDWSKLEGANDEEVAGAASRAAEALHPLKFSLTTDQLAVIQRALHAARTLGNVPSDNLAIELICAEFLSGAAGAVPFPPPAEPKKRGGRKKKDETPPPEA